MLVVEIEFFQQLVTTFVKTTFAPVLGPKDDSIAQLGLSFLCDFVDGLLRQMASTLDLFKAFPTGRSQRGGKVSDAQFFCFLSGNRQAKGKAELAAPAPFRFVFESADILLPLFMVVIAINPRKTKTLCVALALILANLVFFARKDVWIIIEYRRTDVMLHQPLDNG